ncbi:hypothetical protein [Mycobacterium marseillense]|jgi:hypothetical protein|uniref:Transmembrane protein n=1 Tax=Mycobacterium marseillense TaxID=701042 RepID=A0AAC9YMI1_9MYCO|nr:hypothetical protein [Mycobacterium marseillense]ASW92140.1 hypothetical protein CKJ54_21375 [Mycobacterium marseillense]MCA2264429.1 hypothetical protein [Mycobacterium marseillense]MCV7403806.1 hypothetical protein [Mycobacterium marseillense]MDM3976008.1 hypothetical protein [Mycobacterium marseillense]OBJ76464.1 hypothetical protein A5626_16680 [Mycobacterium marseillense]
MSHIGDWFNYQASLKILVFAMLAGAALPGLFALGIRLQSEGAGDITVDGASNGGAPRRNPMLTALAWTIYALVIAVIALALLYIARDFIAHHTGYPLLGAKPK